MSRKHSLSIMLLICTFLLTFLPLAAQQEQGKKTKISERIVEEKQTHQDTTYQEPGTAFFVELLGKPWTSINVDFRINKSSRFSLGTTFYYHYEEEDDDVASFMPSVMYYYLRGKKNKRFEIGGGLSVLPVWHNDVNYDFPIAFHFVIGYRYQKKDGLLFRIGYTLNRYPNVAFQFFGISFGYSW